MTVMWPCSILVGAVRGLHGPSSPMQGQTGNKIVRMGLARLRGLCPKFGYT